MAGFGLFSKTSRRTQRGSLHEVRSEPLCMSEDVLGGSPNSPGDPAGVMSL